MKIFKTIKIFFIINYIRSNCLISLLFFNDNSIYIRLIYQNNYQYNTFLLFCFTSLFYVSILKIKKGVPNNGSNYLPPLLRTPENILKQETSLFHNDSCLLISKTRYSEFNLDLDCPFNWGF
jgi:hypothetical protein